MTLISIIGFLCFVFFFSLLYFRQKKKEIKVGQKTLQDAQDTQSFVELENIEQGVLDLGGKYKAILECTPQNYNLKSNEERKNFILSLRYFFDSLTNPICICVQTKEISLSKFIESIKSKKIILESRYPDNTFMQAYHKSFAKGVEHLPIEYGNTKQKSIYIVLSCDSMSQLYELNEVEKKKEAYRQLDIFSTIIINGLGSAGVMVRRVKDLQILEILYNALNKNGFSNDLFSDTQDFPIIVTSATDITMGITYTEKAKADNLLYGIQNQLNTKLLKEIEDLPNTDEAKKAKVDIINVINQLSDIRKQVEHVLPDTLTTETDLEEEEDDYGDW